MVEIGHQAYIGREYAIVWGSGRQAGQILETSPQ